MPDDHHIRTDVFEVLAEGKDVVVRCGDHYYAVSDYDVISVLNCEDEEGVRVTFIKEEEGIVVTFIADEAWIGEKP